MEKNPVFSTEAAALVSWDKPKLLFTFLGLIPLIILGVYHYHKHRPFLHLFASSVPRKEQHLFLKDLRLRYLFSSLFFAVFLSCVIIALAGPRWGRRIVMEYRRGVDVMFAFDVSRSMDVQDSTPAGEKSRLKHAADIARAMIAASQGIRFGAAIGKGQSLLAVPLTYDVETIRVFLESLSTSIIAGKGGTNLERLLDAASQGFQNTLPTKRCMLVFSDGESWSGSLSAALDRLDAAEITVVAVGMGTEAGGPVPQESGEPPPISYRREAALRNIAERTGGLYVDPNREDAPKVLAEYFIALSPQTGIKGYKIEEQARWRIFMLIGLASFGLAKILEKRMRGRG